jgi:citrate lyase alpha subunit
VLPPIKRGDEDKIVNSVLEEVVEQSGLKLNTSLSFEHRVETPANPIGNGGISVIGVSHMSRTAEYLPIDRISLPI